MENKEAHLEKIRGLFMELGAEHEEKFDSGITFAMLEEKIDAPGVRWKYGPLIWLLDLDNGGSVDVEEFLRGCLNLRGTARAIDVGKSLGSLSVLYEDALMVNSTLSLMVGGSGVARHWDTGVQEGQFLKLGLTWPIESVRLAPLVGGIAITHSATDE
ncbi:unnamed protein product [Symbiodinium sp. KB8]|nr:unnamed protein product [Symbiodinium sp. KB8]